MRSWFRNSLAAAGLVGLMVVGLAALPAAEDPPRFSEWSAPVNLGPVVNSDVNDAGVSISRDGLTLYFGSTRTDTVGEVGDFNIWVSHRASVG